MSSVAILTYLNLLFTGMLAGAELVVHHGLRAPTELLDEKSQLRFRQALILKLRVLVPALFLPAAASGLALAVLDGAAPGLAARCVGVSAMLTWVALRVIGTVPINQATLTWSTDSPPRDWKARIDRAERFHVVGAWAAVVAFACALLR